ncbi:putative methionyl-tRNA synthetase [Hordeum vulgare]|nr:putative methionyl-tRNA synthetase [Hordeum vulgare]
MEEEVEEEEPAELTRSKGRKNKKHAANRKPAESRIKWTVKEDECLAEAWKSISMDPIIDASQNTDTYWRRIKTMFDERKLVDPEFAGIHMERGEKDIFQPLGEHPTTMQQVAWGPGRGHGSPEE